MNDSNPRELRELLARLSDGTLSKEETALLNQCLKSDPIAQEQYLDHMLMDGLLEREFGGGPCPLEKIKTGMAANSIASPKRRSAASRGRRIGRIPLAAWALVPVAASALIAVGWLLWASVSGKSQDRPLHLADSGFESGLMNREGAIPKTAWYGDVFDVTERFSGVIPLEGNRMLRFVKSTVEPEDACELYQIVDLLSVSEVISRRRMAVEASAFFNAIKDEELENDYAFGITVFAFTENPAVQPHVWPMRWEHALTFSGSQTRADTDLKSWQEVRTRLPLPADAKYLVVQLVAIRTDTEETEEEFPGQFVDKVALSLVSSP